MSTDLSAIKKKLGLSSTLPAGTAGSAGVMAGAHLRPTSAGSHSHSGGHSHGAGCECCHPKGDTNEDEK